MTQVVKTNPQMSKIVEVEINDEDDNQGITFSIGYFDVVIYVGIEEIRISRKNFISVMSKLQRALYATV